MNSIVFTLALVFCIIAAAEKNPPAQRRDTLNGTQFDVNVGDDAHIVPRSHETTAVR